MGPRAEKAVQQARKARSFGASLLRHLNERCFNLEELHGIGPMELKKREWLSLFKVSRSYYRKSRKAKYCKVSIFAEHQLKRRVKIKERRKEIKRMHGRRRRS
jgi:hypothetical protein